MYACVVIQLGVKRCNELCALTGSYNMSTNHGKCLGISRHSVDVRRTNERHRHIVANSLKMSFGIETAELTAVGITTHVNIHCRETVGWLLMASATGA